MRRSLRERYRAVGLLAVCVLFSAIEGAAQEGPVAPPAFGEIFFRMLPMVLLVMMIWYLMVIKPQQLKIKKHGELISSLKKGALVVTTGGIIGRVAPAEKDYILLEIASNVKIKVEPAHIERQFENKEVDQAA